MAKRERAAWELEAGAADTARLLVLLAQAQAQQQRKARRCWSPELHRRFVAALQRLGGAQGQE